MEQIGFAKIFCTFIFGIYSLVLLCVFISNLCKDFKTRKYITVPGVVVRREKTDKCSEGHPYYRAVATFEIGNETFEINSDNVIVGYPESVLPAIGTKVDIKVNPDNPDETMWGKGVWGILSYVIFLGLFLLGVGVYTLLMLSEI